MQSHTPVLRLRCHSAYAARGDRAFFELQYDSYYGCTAVQLYW